MLMSRFGELWFGADGVFKRVPCAKRETNNFSYLLSG
jgi:hypothetical protein